VDQAHFLEDTNTATGDDTVHPLPTSPAIGPPGRLAKRIAAAVLAMQTACARGGPSLVFLGTYFPVWLACSVFGIAIAGAARMPMVLWGLSQRFPYQLLLCTVIGGASGILVGRLWLGL